MLQPGTYGRTLLMLGGWGCGSFGMLQLHSLPVDFGHGICGPWGCGPPVQALLACHGFWLVSFAALLWACRTGRSLRHLFLVGRVALLLGTLGLIGVALHEAIVWWPHVGELQRSYAVQRYLFSLVVLTDVPVAEVTLFGACATWMARSRMNSAALSRAAGDARELCPTTQTHSPAAS